MIRFNEAIDEMVAQSIQQFAQSTDYVRDLFAGVLAHDLRSPVGAMLNSVYVVLCDENLSPASVRAAANLQRGAERVKLMIDDLFVFTRTRLGDPLPVVPTRQDLGRICRGAIEEVLAANPDAQIDLQSDGPLMGQWDGERMNQLVINLLNNAIRYGSGIITLVGEGEGDHVTFSVSNGGVPIPAHALPTLFDPLTRASTRLSTTSQGMGLGLYICRCIAKAHHGTICVTSDDRQTVVTVELPRFSTSHP